MLAPLCYNSTTSCNTVHLSDLCGPQVVLAMNNGRRDSRPLQHAAARAALWMLNDLPAAVETLLFPDNVRTPVCAASHLDIPLSRPDPHSWLQSVSQLLRDCTHFCWWQARPPDDASTCKCKHARGRVMGLAR